MKLIRKLISLVTIVTLILSTSSIVFAQGTEETISSYEEIVTLNDGSTYRFVHTMDMDGNTTVCSYNESGQLVDTASYNPSTDELFLNGELLAPSTSTTDNSLYAARAGNWKVGATDTRNFELAGRTLSAVAAAVAAYTHGAASVLTEMLGMYFDALSSLSAARTIYLNYVDYSPKVGGYYYSTIYSGPNATGKNLGTVKSAVFVR